MTRPPSNEEFVELVETCWPGLYRTACMLLGDAAAAEDLVQTALTKTYANWRKVRAVEAAPGYARTTMMNTAASWLRKRSWRNERPSDRLPEPVGSEPADPADRPTLMRALAQLPRGQRTVVVLRFYEDMTVPQTAHALGVSEGTVKSQTAEAMGKLRALLGDVIPEGAA